MEAENRISLNRITRRTRGSHVHAKSVTSRCIARKLAANIAKQWYDANNLNFIESDVLINNILGEAALFRDLEKPSELLHNSEVSENSVLRRLRFPPMGLIDCRVQKKCLCPYHLSQLIKERKIEVCG